MVFNTTYKNKEYDKESAILVGEKFSLMQRLKRGGIGSGRMVVESTSEKLNLAKLKFSETNFGSIELRPKGIIVHYAVKLQNFAWVIPYYHLVIYNAQFFSIHANGNFIQFEKNKNYRENKKFIDRLIALKIENLPASHPES